jgi:hypothetical protein
MFKASIPCDFVFQIAPTILARDPTVEFEYDLANVNETVVSHERNSSAGLS